MRMIYVCIISMVERQIPVWGEVMGNVNNMWSAVVVSDDNDVNMCVIVRITRDPNCTTGYLS